MDPVTDGGTARDDLRSRRGRMRDSARGLHAGSAPGSDAFQTPEWLERSFVLPLTEPEGSDVPTQPVPHHDDYEEHLAASSTPGPQADPARAFVRPPSKDIDFARVIRRADLSRAASRVAVISTSVAGLVLIVYLLTKLAIVLGMSISFAVVAVVALALRIRLATVEIPHLER